jgi:thiosulfate reductase cytochrome b subunit
VPTREELRQHRPLDRRSPQVQHPTGEAATRYNVLQSLTYLIVIFGLLPLVVIARSGAGRRGSTRSFTGSPVEV